MQAEPIQIFALVAQEAIPAKFREVLPLLKQGLHFPGRMVNNGLNDMQLQLIRREVQAQVREEFGGMIKSFERRVANLESRLDPVMSTSNKRQGSDFSGSLHLPFKLCCGSYAVLEQASVEEVAMASGHETQSEPGQLPESMFNYCMQRLSLSREPLSDPAFLWWIILFVCQFITMSAFSVLNDVTTKAQGIPPFAERDRALTNCMFKNAYMFGMPAVQYCIGYVAILLTASVIRSDDAQTLVSMCPHQRNYVLQWISYLAWFWQLVYLPGVFALEAATLFARSMDAMVVVMNTLAVTFIMDIDKMFYQNFLGEEQKNAYQKCTSAVDAGHFDADSTETRDGHRDDTKKREPDLSEPAVSQITWVMLGLNIVLMGIVFTYMVITLGTGQVYGEKYLVSYDLFVGPCYVLVFFGRSLCIQHFAHGKHWLAGSSQALGMAICGVCLYMLSVDFVTFRFLVPPIVDFSLEDFQACLPG